MDTVILTTTINIPHLLLRYAQNVREFGHEHVAFIVIGDRKTPPATADFCAKLQQQFDLSVTYVDLEAQQRYLARFPGLWEYLPFDSIMRRNIGFLMAYEQGADLTITIDDDNFVTNQDFVGHHAVVMQTTTLPVYESSTGWLNVCAFLEEQHGECFYHRGHPLSQRWRDEIVTREHVAGRVVVNAGLWLDAPDIDAFTWLHRPVVATGLREASTPRSALARSTWAPFNSQNTALARRALPAYFLCPYIGRYDDIWASYCIRAIADHLGDYVTYGLPLVRQVRNAHKLWDDIDRERFGAERGDWFIEALQGCTLRQTTYSGCFEELVASLADRLQQGLPWPKAEQDRLYRVVEGMKLWRETFSILTTADS